MVDLNAVNWGFFATIELLIVIALFFMILKTTQK